MAVATYLGGTLATLLSTELNSMANNALKVPASGGTYSAGGGYLLAEFELFIASFSAAPAANTGFSLWLLRAIDGTNYADGFDATVTPACAPNGVFALRAVSTAQRPEPIRIVIPPGTWIPLLKNDGTGVTAAASGNTLKVLPLTYQQ